MSEGKNLQEVTDSLIDAEQTEDDTSLVEDLWHRLGLLALLSMFQTRDNNDSAGGAGNFTSIVDETETRNEEVSVPLMDDTPFGANLEVPYMDAGPSEEMHNTSEELTTEQTETDEFAVLDPEHLLRILAFLSISNNRDKNDSVPRSTGNLADEIEEFISGMRRLYNIRGREVPTDTDEVLRRLLADWNEFLQLGQGVQGTSAITSSNIKEDVNMFILWQELLGAQWHEDDKNVIQERLQRWNILLQARAGETLVTGCNLFLTIVGLILYLVDLGSDIATAIFFAGNGQWCQAIVTFAIVYTAVIFYTLMKWKRRQIPCTDRADWIRYVASLLVNWPDVKLYGALCLLEWKLFKSPMKNAHLVSKWHERRVSVAFLKISEGVWEACPQAILQLYLLVPDLYRTWTWTDYLRIVGASVSLCTAGAALVNLVKCGRIMYYTELPLSELVVLHVWAVPVTVSRLLSLGLLLSVHPYWVLAGVALHLVLHGVYRCRTNGVPCQLYDVNGMCLETLYFLISPFAVDYSIKYRHVYHAIHFLCNTAMMVMWALGTPLVCAHPALYTAIICFNAVMFAVGLVAWQIHEKHWARQD